MNTVKRYKFYRSQKGTDAGKKTVNCGAFQKDKVCVQNEQLIDFSFNFAI